MICFEARWERIYTAAKTHARPPSDRNNRTGTRSKRRRESGRRVSEVTAQQASSAGGFWLVYGHSLPSLWRVGRQQRITPPVSTGREGGPKATNDRLIHRAGSARWTKRTGWIHRILYIALQEATQPTLLQYAAGAVTTTTVLAACHSSALLLGDRLYTASSPGRSPSFIHARRYARLG